MPLYTVMTETGVLSKRARQHLAAGITKLHSHYADLPENWVHVVFHDYPPGYGFTAGRPAPTVSLTLIIRDGRSPDYKRGLLERLWELLQAATGAPDDQIVIGIQEIPASQAMEMGKAMPDVAAG